MTGSVPVRPSRNATSLSPIGSAVPQYPQSISRACRVLTSMAKIRRPSTAKANCPSSVKWNESGGFHPSPTPQNSAVTVTT